MDTCVYIICLAVLQEAARRAKLLGTQLQPGSPPLSLFWGACVGERLPRMSMPMRKSSKVLKQRSTFGKYLVEQ